MMLAHGIETVAYGFLFWLAVLMLPPVIVSTVLVRSPQVPRWFSLMVLLVTFGISLPLVYPLVAGLSGATQLSDTASLPRWG